eukprot:7742742-Pyramimonas_sp.AAC.1
MPPRLRNLHERYEANATLALERDAPVVLLKIIEHRACGEAFGDARLGLETLPPDRVGGSPVGPRCP